MFNIFIGTIVGLLSGVGFVYWLRNQPDVKVPFWIDVGGVILITLMGFFVGFLRNYDNKKSKNKNS